LGVQPENARKLWTAGVQNIMRRFPVSPGINNISISRELVTN